MVLVKIQIFWDATMCQMESVKCIKTVYHSVWHNIPEDLNQRVSKCRIGPPSSEVDMYAANFTPQYENLAYAVCLCFPPLVMHALCEV